MKKHYFTYSKGVSPYMEAKLMLTIAFMSDVLERIRLDSLRSASSKWSPTLPRHPLLLPEITPTPDLLPSHYIFYIGSTPVFWGCFFILAIMGSSIAIALRNIAPPIATVMKSNPEEISIERLKTQSLA